MPNWVSKESPKVSWTLEILFLCFRMRATLWKKEDLWSPFMTHCNRACWAQKIEFCRRKALWRLYRALSQIWVHWSLEDGSKASTFKISCSMFLSSPSIGPSPEAFHLRILDMVRSRQIEKARRRDTFLYLDQALETLRWQVRLTSS